MPCLPTPHGARHGNLVRDGPCRNRFEGWRGRRSVGEVLESIELQECPKCLWNAGCVSNCTEYALESTVHLVHEIGGVILS